MEKYSKYKSAVSMFLKIRPEARCLNDHREALLRCLRLTLGLSQSEAQRTSERDWNDLVFEFYLNKDHSVRVMRHFYSQMNGDEWPKSLKKQVLSDEEFGFQKRYRISRVLGRDLIPFHFDRSG